MNGKPQDREPPARELIEGHGGRLHHCHFLLGECDGLAFVEFPDDPSAAATGMRASATPSACARMAPAAMPRPLHQEIGPHPFGRG
ncbi:MAG: GYD domain-containing protein [Acetobacteraceae bacterium]|nr:GYD domain-containing protein [Acetobacteraceae bacterium]